MSNFENLTKTYTCEDCGMISTDHRIFKISGKISRDETFVHVRCYSEGACDRRQKRNAILAQTPTHPVDKFSRISLGICAALLMSVILACVFFLIGL